MDTVGRRGRCGWGKVGQGWVRMGVGKTGWV